MKRCLLDSTTLVIDPPTKSLRVGLAIAWLKRNPRARLWISPVTWAEKWKEQMILRLSDPILCATSGRASEERMLTVSRSISHARQGEWVKRRLAGRSRSP